MEVIMLKHLVAASLALIPTQLPAASAAGPTGSATIEWQREARDMVILEDVAWKCAGNDCRGTLGSSGARAVARYCSMLARYGQVTSFTTSAGQLGETELADCNKRRRG